MAQGWGGTPIRRWPSDEPVPQICVKGRHTCSLPCLPAVHAQKKTEEEAALLRYANKVGSQGHVAMMQAARPGMMEYEVSCGRTVGAEWSGVEEL